MSLTGYFNKFKPAVRMPRSENGAPDELGMRCNGRVLNGGLSMMEALRMDALAVQRAAPTPYGEPDPVLRYHLRIDKT